MYTDKDYPTKAALKADVAAGVEVTYFQPGPFGGSVPRDGEITLEGPHYPKPHRWYARAKVAGGRIIKVLSLLAAVGLGAACSGPLAPSPAPEAPAATAVFESLAVEAHGDGELGQCALEPAQAQLCHAGRSYRFSKRCVRWHLTHHPADYPGACVQ